MQIANPSKKKTYLEIQKPKTKHTENSHIESKKNNSRIKQRLTNMQHLPRGNIHNYVFFFSEDRIINKLISKCRRENKLRSTTSLT